ncbi:Clavaminate synthase-like protein, partial [Glonium stellatum]
FSNSRESLHSDNCEVMGLYCLDTALKGGRILVTSSWQLHNELAAKRPDVLKTLAELWIEFPYHRFKHYTQSPPLCIPFLDNVDGERVLLRFSRYPITGWQQRKRNPTLPTPVQAQLEAIDAVQFMAAANSVPLPMGRGDMVFVNDMTILYAREGFSEGGVYMKRHLLKMSFRNPEQN